MSIDTLKAMLDQHLQQIEELIGTEDDKAVNALAELLGLMGDAARKLSSLDLGDDALVQDLIDMAEVLEGHQETLESDEDDEDDEEENKGE